MMLIDEFGEAYKKGRERTMKVLMARGLDRDSATDAAQTAWLKALSRLDHLRDHGKIKAWVNRIAVNQNISDFRRLKVRVEPLETDEVAGGAEINLASIDIKMILPMLPPRPRYVIQRVYIDGCSRRTVAKEMGISRNALNKIVKRAFRRLRKKLGLPQPRPLPRKGVGRQERAIQKALTSK